MKLHAFCLSVLSIALPINVLLVQPAQLSAQVPTEIFSDGFESSWVHRWDGTVGVAPLPFLDVDSALKGSTLPLPVGGTNAKERALMVHYLGTGKSIDGQAREQLPFRAYFATCDVETESPKMYVSLTLADTGPGANPDHPRKGSIFELEYNSVSGLLQPTANHAVLDICNESHGIAVSSDCSQVAVLCATTIEEPVTPTYPGTLRDLVSETSQDSFYTRQTDNVAIIDGIPGLTQEEREARYLHNGEIWLLEWPNGRALSAESDKYVIHKGYGGHPFSPVTLTYGETDDTYGAAFTTSLFDSNHGRRHRSAALMVVDRKDGWELNPDDRGWAWACADGHVFQISSFWNPYRTDERAGEYAALCTSDGNDWEAFQAGTVATKYESSELFEGYSNYLVASNSSGVMNGGAHKMIPMDENRSIGILVGPEMEPWHDSLFTDYVAMTEQDAANFYGPIVAQRLGLTGLNACNWWDDGWCLFGFTRWEIPGTYPLFEWGFWWKDLSSFVPTDLSKIGIFHQEASGRSIAQEDGQLAKWLAEDEDCMLGAPQLVDLENGRYLLGFGKFQCISDGFHLRRFATGANGTRSVSTLIPKQYYLMEIDADGHPLTQPTPISGAGWGALDSIVGMGKGRAAWAYVPDPTLQADGTFADPEQDAWRLMVYESPFDGSP
ncbi:MAG: hypothetical protein AAGD06_20720 [Acidobacteriota bacterium]